MPFVEFMMRIALHGIPGAGKSTLARLLLEEFGRIGRQAVVVRLAEPLYQLQSLVYRLAGSPLPDPAVQDGLLLADLAGHLRRINPDALTADFRRRVERLADTAPEAVMVCDDLRVPDINCVRDLGFTLVRVDADPELRRARRAQRGDLTCREERGMVPAAVSDVVVRNDGSLAELRAAAQALVGRVTA